jgi:hypothetical protein
MKLNRPFVISYIDMEHDIKKVRQSNSESGAYEIAGSWLYKLMVHRKANVYVTIMERATNKFLLRIHSSDVKKLQENNNGNNNNKPTTTTTRLRRDGTKTPARTG